MKKLKPKPYQFWAWCFTLTILTGALVAALGLYPFYCYIFLVGKSTFTSSAIFSTPGPLNTKSQVSFLIHFLCKLDEYPQ